MCSLAERVAARAIMSEAARRGMIHQTLLIQGFTLLLGEMLHLILIHRLRERVVVVVFFF